LQVLPAGQAVLCLAPGPFAGVLPEALASLDAQTLERLDQDLAHLIAALHAGERAAGIPLAQMLPGPVAPAGASVSGLVRR
jgi:hypothetical protein